MPTETSPQAVLFISPDLLFAGKIQGAAAPLGLKVLQQADFKTIPQILADHAVCIVLLDLNLPAMPVEDVMELLPKDHRPLVVAYGPHVNTARLEEARTAGCDRVLPRSRFMLELPDLLKQATH